MNSLRRKQALLTNRLALILTLAACTTWMPAEAQKAKTKPIGLDATLREAMRTAPKAADLPNSDFVKLLDFGTVTVKPDGTVVAEYRETYKLFNERARRIAEVDLPYNSSYQELTVQRARTIKKNGRILDLMPSEIRSSSLFSDFALYDDSVSEGFSMPGIEDDCVIDYSYRRVSRPLLMPGEFWDYWGFSDRDPIQHCRYVLNVPASRKLQFKVYDRPGFEPKVSLSANGKTKTYVWELKDLPPIEVEPSMPPSSEVRVWLQATSISSWDSVARWFWGLAKPQAITTSAIKSTVAGLTAGKQTDEAKARAIYDWVANQVRYVGLEFGLSAFRPHATTQVYEKLYGDCKDKSLLLVTMLGIAGIKAHPVLLHTDSQHSVRERLPSLDAFDHCIALADVGGKQVWLDATAETCEYGDIPGSVRGAEALVTREAGGEFMRIPAYAAEENGGEAVASVVLAADGSAEVEMELRFRGSLGQQMRAYARQATPDQRKQLVQAMGQSIASGAVVKSSDLPDGAEKAGPFLLKMKLSASAWARRVGNSLLVPMSMGKIGADARNPFAKETRHWPIVNANAMRDFGELTISLPEGFEVEETPQDANLDAPLSSYRRTVRKSVDGRSLTVRIEGLTQRGTAPAKDYPGMKRYFDEMIRIAGDVLILRSTK